MAWLKARPMVTSETDGTDLTYPTENQNRNENFTRLKGKRDRNYQQLKRYYFLLSVFHKILFIPFSSGMERPACPLWQICNTITGTQEKFAFKRTDVKQWQTYSPTLSPTRIWIHHVESKFFLIRIWSPPRFTPCTNAEASNILLMWKMNLEKKNRLFHRELSVSWTT